jgi:hypothetical protein
MLGFGLKVTDLNERTDKLLQMRARHEPNRRLLADLVTERERLFTCLTEPNVQATNWRAEQALRPPTEHRPARSDDQRAALPTADRQRADQAPRPRVPDHSRRLRSDAEADPDPRNPLPDRLLRTRSRSSNRHPRCHRQAFIAVTGTIDEHNTMTGQGTHAGPLPLLRRLASVIADDERLTS